MFWRKIFFIFHIVILSYCIELWTEIVTTCSLTGPLPRRSSSVALWGRAVRWWQGSVGLKYASCLMNIISLWLRPDPASLWRSWDGKIFPLLVRRSWRLILRYLINPILQVFMVLELPIITNSVESSFTSSFPSFRPGESDIWNVFLCF